MSSHISRNAANFPLGFVVLVTLVVYFFVRRRSTKPRESWVNGVEKPERSFFSRKSKGSAQYTTDPHPVASSPVSDAHDVYTPTPYTVSSTGSIFHPLTERPMSAYHLSPVVARRTHKIAELDQARRLAVVGAGVGSSMSSSSASPLEPHGDPLPSPLSPLSLTPDSSTAQRASTAAAAADSSMVPSVASPTNTSASNQRRPLQDSHPIGPPASPPPQYDTVV